MQISYVANRGPTVMSYMAPCLNKQIKLKLN